MSEGETVTEGEGGDNGGLFCQSCSPTCRKICYYATFGLGFIAFIFGIIKLIEGEVLFLVIGASLILLSPLWIKSVSGCCSDMKNALRLSSFLIFFAFFVATIVFYIMKWKALRIISGICLGLSGIWYFLSFIDNGQRALIECLKACCCCGGEK